MTSIRQHDVGRDGEGDATVAASATAFVTWIGRWGKASFDCVPLRGDALTWSSEAVICFVASNGREQPVLHDRDEEDTPCTHSASPSPSIARDTRSSEPAGQPWWVEAQTHSEGPADDESIPRKLEGWWRVLEFEGDDEERVAHGSGLVVGDMCFLEKLWSDRVRVSRQGQPMPFDVVPLTRLCDLQLIKRRDAHVGSKWKLLRDACEEGDDPDEIRVGQRRLLLGGTFGTTKLEGMECHVLSYLESMDRWSVELPLKGNNGRNVEVAVVPAQLVASRMPVDPRPASPVDLSISLREGALEIDFKAGDDGFSIGGAHEQQSNFRLRLRYVSRIRPGGRSWTANDESVYVYKEVRYVAEGNAGLVFRVLRVVDERKRVFDGGNEDPHAVLDVPHGSDRAAIARAYRRLARRCHPDKVPENEREQAELEFRRIHQAYENLLGNPEESSDLLVLKMQHPDPPRPSKQVTVASAFQTEVRCLSLASQLRLPNVAKLAEVGPDNVYIVTWPYLPEAIVPANERDGLNQVDRVDLVRQGWSDFSRSRKSAQKVVQTMISLIRHDLMIVDPMPNILVDRESGEPLFIDFGRAETEGSVYTTRIRTFMKKVLTLLLRSICRSPYDVAARFIRDVENTLFAELERWQDERTRDQKRALALRGSSTKWQEGVEQCREIWASTEENPLRQMFMEEKGVLPGDRQLRPPRPPEDMPIEPGDESGGENQPDDDPEGYCDADISTLTPLQLVLRAKRKKARRAKLPVEKASLRIKVDETLPDGTLGLGLDDASEDQRGVIVVEVNPKVRAKGWTEGDRIIEVNGKTVDDWEEFRSLWQMAKALVGCAVFGIVREGFEVPPEPKKPKCLHCSCRGGHLQRCTTWRPLPQDEDCVYFCSRDCQREAWRLAKRQGASTAVAA
eukprot:TRINITY_DN38555_c0_g2_i1.p1 TRINITY_DN38555_c0_g2~~TRINITY_DN38555_c0_g2_i1.p1  ORF type:complete len:905 (-),score=164.62 TRINITY_DN38555_c0_g2_i1:155-2869(-)